MQNHKTSNKIHILSHFLLLLNLFLAMTSMRLGDLLNFPAMRFEIYFLFLLGSFFGFLSCCLLNKKMTCSILLFFIAIFLHAWCFFYQPSLKSGIAVQDYLLQNAFSANFAIKASLLPPAIVLPSISLSVNPVI